MHRYPIVAAAALSALAGLASASEPASTGSSSDLPAYQVLACPGGACARSTHAIPISKPKPDFSPRGLPNEEHVEAVVDIQYTIGTDGNAHDVVCRRLMGPDELDRRAIEAVQQWKFTPGTVEGKPVEQIETVRFVFMQYDSPRYNAGASPAIIRAHNDAKAFIRAGKLADAKTLLEEKLHLNSLSLYERTMLALLLADVLRNQGDFAGALRQSRLSLLDEGKFLDAKAVDPALLLAFELEVRAGEYARALAIADMLKARGQLKADDPVSRAVADINSAIAGPTAIPVIGRVPLETEPDRVWTHALVRRAFQFDRINGHLERFQLSCDQEAISSQISETAAWHVPQRWSDCFVTVYGTPGTTFRLLEVPSG